MSDSRPRASRDVSGMRPAVRVTVLVAGAVVLVAWSLGATFDDPQVGAFATLTGVGVLARLAQPRYRGPNIDVALAFVGALVLVTDGALAVWGAAIIGSARFLRGDPWSRVGMSAAVLTLAQSAASFVRDLAEELLAGQPVIEVSASGAMASRPFGVATALVVALVLASTWELLRWATAWIDRRDRADAWRSRAEARWLVDLSLAGTAVMVAVAWSQYPPLVLLLLVPVLTGWRLAAASPAAAATPGAVEELGGVGSAAVLRLALAEELIRAEQFERPLAILLIDVDGLGRLNTVHGEDVGDEAVRTVVHAARTVARDYDVVARVSDDAFAVLLPEAPREGAHGAAERMRALIESRPLRVDGRDVPLTVSIGVAAYPGDATTREGLLTEAELAAEYAMLEGGNRVQDAARLPKGFRANPVRRDDTTDLPPVTEPLAPDRLVRATFEPLAAARPRTDRLLLVVAALSLAAAAVAVALVPDPVVVPLTLLFAGLAVGAEWFAESVYGRANSSWAAVPLIALAVHPDTVPLAVVVAGIVAGVGGGLLRGVRARQLFYNGAVLVLATLAAWLLAQPLLEVRGDSLLGAVAVGLLCGAAFFAVDTWLIATAVAVSERLAIFAVWQDDLLWLVPHQLGMGLLGGAMAYAQEGIGTGGTLVLVLPALALHVAQRQFVRRTRDHVIELRNLNDDMIDANRRTGKLNERLTEALEQVNSGYLVTVESLAASVDVRDGYDGAHPDRLEAYGRRLLEVLAPDLAEDDAVLWGFRLHDLGKCGVPDRVLQKPGPLDDEEWALVRRHPEVGAELVSAAPFLQGARDVILHHHERWDGRGYPYGLSAQAIPFTARLFAVVNAYDAMTSDRPYRRALAQDEALKELVRGAGTSFDPEVVDAFVQIPLEDLALIRRQVEDQRGVARAARSGGPLIRIAAPRGIDGLPTGTLPDLGGRLL